MSFPSIAPAIMKRPWLKRWMEPLSTWYFDNAGYRKLGLRYAMAVGTKQSPGATDRPLRYMFLDR